MAAPRSYTRYESLMHDTPRRDPSKTLAYVDRPAGQSTDTAADDTVQRHGEFASTHSRTPLRENAPPSTTISIPMLPTAHARFAEGQTNSDKQSPSAKPPMKTPPALSRQSTGNSWLNATATEHKHPYGQIPGARRSDPNLLFAEGDFPKNRFTKTWIALLSTNIVFRWTCYILPIAALLWIPGILGETAVKSATVWSVRLLWWSIWLTVVWVGWWGAVAATWFVPTILNYTIGIISPEMRPYIMYLSNCRRWLAVWGWVLMCWITFNPLILGHGPGNASTGNGHTLHQIIQGLFGLFLASCLLLVEKVIVQMIARNFHKKSFQDRIEVNKQQISSLVQLYLYSHDIGRTDTLDRAWQQGSPDPSRYLKKALKGVANAAKTGATALGTVASEIAGERVLQPNSPMSMVLAALQSANKSRQLARRIFFSYRPNRELNISVTDIAHCFANREQATDAFGMFDQDGNGDLTLEELEMATLEVHRERLALASSMRDVDSAVARLDQILMILWWIAAVLIIVSMLDVSFSTILAGAGTFVLGLSWLIGASAQEILASCIFLFVKHAYDVSDRVDVDGVGYVVKEMHLLYTIFRQVDGKVVQIPHSLLNTKVITNIRRSGPISETFTWDVDFQTTYEQIEALRDEMMTFLEQESRDFRTVMDISISDFAGQGKMSLNADICYKSNWQNGTLKAQRRNKWIIALKEGMRKHSIWGPDGAGNPKPDPVDPTVVKLLNSADAAPAYERRTPTSPEPAAPPASAASPMSPTTPAQAARGLSSPHGPIDDASADIFRGGQGRRASIDHGARSLAIPREPMSSASMPSARPSEPSSASLDQRGRSTSRTNGSDAHEVLEMRQR